MPDRVRICVVGAGAIGGWLGARLAVAGNADVSALARGATLAALTDRGWRLATSDGVVAAPARAADRPEQLGRQDVVLVSVKAPALPAVAPAIAGLLDPDTVVVPFMNGVPWWFGRGTELGDGPLRSLDPDGAIAAAIPFDRVLGGVVHASCVAPEPGLSRHVMGNGLIVGEPAGGVSARAELVGALLRGAGFQTTVSRDVRSDIWFKLWGNMTMNPASAITGATIDQLLADPLVRRFCSTAMSEAAVLGARLGCPIEQSPEDRHAVTAQLGAFRTSMLQDVDAGRVLELDALIGAVHEMAARLGTPTPAIDALFGLARLFATTHGLR